MLTYLLRPPRYESEFSTIALFTVILDFARFEQINESFLVVLFHNLGIKSIDFFLATQTILGFAIHLLSR